MPRTNLPQSVSDFERDAQIVDEFWRLESAAGLAAAAEALAVKFKITRQEVIRVLEEDDALNNGNG